MLLKKIFGEKNTIQRELVINVIVTILIVLIVSILFCLFAINGEINNRLENIELLQDIEIKAISDITKRNFILTFFNITVLSGILINFTAKKIYQPIKQITNATKEVASGNFDIELETDRKDEIAELINNFNLMVKELRSIEGLQKDFVDNVSHEIKTPISSIQGFAQLLQENNITDEEKKEYSNIIIEESNRLLNLSNNMLKLSKLQNKELISNKQKIDISKQINNAIRLLENNWKEKNINFNVDLKKEYFYGDEELIFQVWINLIENAIKFSKENNNIDILIERSKDRIFVYIKDYGIGIENTDKIFDRFYQDDASHSQTGSGLGLAIVKRILDLSKGKIKVESKKDIGTTFIVELPRYEEHNKITIS